MEVFKGSGFTITGTMGTIGMIAPEVWLAGVVAFPLVVFVLFPSAVAFPGVVVFPLVVDEFEDGSGVVVGGGSVVELPSGPLFSVPEEFGPLFSVPEEFGPFLLSGLEESGPELSERAEESGPLPSGPPLSGPPCSS